MVELYNEPCASDPQCYYCSVTAVVHRLHVILGILTADTGDALVITSYYPGLDRWEPDLMTRRRKDELYRPLSIFPA